MDLIGAYAREDNIIMECILLDTLHYNFAFFGLGLITVGNVLDKLRIKKGDDAPV